MFGFELPKVPHVSSKEVKNSLDAREDVVLLDVRTVGEYSKGKIEGGINLPVDEVMSKVESVIHNKSQKVYVYCLSGSRSVHAVDAMVKLGYKNVFDLSHGLLGWRTNGYPVVA